MIITLGVSSSFSPFFFSTCFSFSSFWPSLTVALSPFSAFRTRRNPSKWWFDPCKRASPAFVSATFSTPLSRSAAPSASTRAPLLQNTSTFERARPCAASSAQTRRSWCSMSASRFPPVQRTNSVLSAAGSLCRCGDASRVSAGWYRSR